MPALLSFSRRQRSSAACGPAATAVAEAVQLFVSEDTIARVYAPDPTSAGNLRLEAPHDDSLVSSRIAA
jgi:hypothetical protein